eukprot:scaffold1537_cov108-Cylindrotheca_fusiformis.AAC.14
MLNHADSLHQSAFLFPMSQTHCKGNSYCNMIRPNVARSNSINTHNPVYHSPGSRAKLRSSRSRGQKTTTLRFSCIVLSLLFAIMCLGMISIYGMLYVTNGIDKPAPNRQLRNVSPAKVAAWIQEVRDEFQQRYGAQYADALFEKGVQSFGSLDATAERMLQAAQENRPFVVAFSGYSITVGRGNFLNQSFPFVMERVLQQPMRNILGVSLIVRNAAIGGIPSFPYGFCLEHFLGADPDVIGWDYSMNEGPKDSSVLEAFIRQASQQLPNRPMLIMLDRNGPRTTLLEQYTKLGYLRDAIAVSKKEVVDENVFQEDPVPTGFQEWDEFGAPRNCPGRGSWHPKRQEHAMIGWLMVRCWKLFLTYLFQDVN